MPNDSPIDELLRLTLSEAGINFDLRQNAKGATYAGFRMEIGPGDFLGLTAMFRGRVLQFTAHQVFSAASNPDLLLRINKVNLDWSNGCLYYNEARHCCDASESLYFSGPPLDSRVVRQVIGNLSLACRNIRSCLSGSLPWKPCNLDVPPTENGDNLGDLQESLAFIGQPFSVMQEGRILTQHYRQLGYPDFYVEIFKMDRRFLCVRARQKQTTPVTEANVLRKVQFLNGRLPIGQSAIEPDQFVPYYFLCLPLAWARVDGELCSWLIDSAASAVNAMAEL